MKYNDIIRLSNDELDKLRHKWFHDDEETAAIQEILDFYYPIINTILANNNLDIVVSNKNVKINFSDNTYNNRAHILSVEISCLVFTFYLEEMFNNCGMLVSTNTYVGNGYRKLGIGTVLHAIKEDIARITGYSFMMYTDSVNQEVLKPNQKIMNDIGAKEVFRGTNKRSSSNIAVWIKDLTNYYENRQLKVAVEAMEETN